MGVFPCFRLLDGEELRHDKPSVAYRHGGSDGKRGRALPATVRDDRALDKPGPAAA
jgi:hypothetical protein